MTKKLTPWISDTFPNFIAADHPQFRKFLETYYDYLERNNIQANVTPKTIFNDLPNAGGVINQLTDLRDVDLTPDVLYQFFEKEFVPFALNSESVERNIFLKKVRDVYLSKGTPKSFRLFFRLLFEQEIDIFEARDNILDCSEGKYVGFPTATFRVTGFVDSLPDLDFTLATVEQDLDNDENPEILATVLSGLLIGGSVTSPIVSLQLSESIPEFDDNGNPILIRERVLRLRDPVDEQTFIEVQPQLALSELQIETPGSGYLIGDRVGFKGISSNRNYNLTVTRVSSGKVDGVYVRDRGEYYQVGDQILFEADNASQGSGGGATITAVDRHGRIMAIDNIQVRSGAFNAGYPADTFEDAKIPVMSGGTYRELPRAVVTMVERAEGVPAGQGAVITPYSESIGQIEEFDLRERGYFSDSDDIELEVPMNVVFENATEFVSGEVVSFQVFDPNGPAFEADPEVLVFEYRYTGFVSDSDFDSDYSQLAGITVGLSDTRFQLPWGFNFETDSELFVWENGFPIDPIEVNDNFFGPDDPIPNNVIDADFSDSDARIAFRVDSENQTGFDFTFLRGLFERYTTLSESEYRFNTVNDSDHDSDSIFRITIDSKRFNNLDYYHFNQLNRPRFQNANNNRSLSFEWFVKEVDAKKGQEEVLGRWENTGFYGVVENVSTNRTSISVRPIRIRPFPEDSDLDQLSVPRFTILRLASANAATGDITIREGLASANIISNYRTAKFTPILSASSQISSRNFISEDGFLNSLSGGVIQDGLFYSNYSYTIQSELQMSDWRVPVRTTLHPAGTLLFGEYNLNSNEDYSGTGANVDYSRSNVKFTFDASNDFRGQVGQLSPLNVSNTYYDANAFNIYLRSAPDGITFTADNYFNDRFIAQIQESGNSWWDYEPIGLVRSEYIQVTDAEMTELVEERQGRVFDSDYDSDAVAVDSVWVLENVLKRVVTTQDSDGFGYVQANRQYFALFDGTKQDLYKTGARHDIFPDPAPTYVPPAPPEPIVNIPLFDQVWIAASQFLLANPSGGLRNEYNFLFQDWDETGVGDATLMIQWLNSGDGRFYPMTNTDVTVFRSSGMRTSTRQIFFGLFGTFNEDLEAIFVPNFGIFTNQPILSMSSMFGSRIESVALDRDIQYWDTSEVQAMNGMFSGVDFSRFDNELSEFGLSNDRLIDPDVDARIVSRTSAAFRAWDTSSVTSMDQMFINARFRIMNNYQILELGTWDTSSVTSMFSMFRNSDFNEDISGWDVSSVTDMSFMFADDSDFNNGDPKGTVPGDSDLNSWNTSNVTTIEAMFQNASSFNQAVGEWDLSSVRNMDNVFDGATDFNNGE